MATFWNASFANRLCLMIVTLILYISVVIILERYHVSEVSFSGVTPRVTRYNGLSIINNHSTTGNKFIKTASFDTVEWVKSPTDNTSKLFRAKSKYNPVWIGNTELEHTSCQLLQTIHNSNISKIGLFGDSLSRNTYDALLLDFKSNTRHQCTNNKIMEIKSLQCTEFFYESNVSDNFVNYRVQTEWQQCAIHYRTGTQKCGGIRPKYTNKPRFQNKNVSFYDCNCQPRRDCLIRYQYVSDNFNDTMSVQLSFLESYRIYPNLTKYYSKMNKKMKTFMWSVGPKLLKDYVREMDVLIGNLGQHYSSSVHFIQTLTFIADVLLDSIMSAKRYNQVKSAIYRLSYPQHFTNKNYDNVEYGLHEFWHTGPHSKCLEYGKVAERHWTDVLAQSVYNIPAYQKISILDYYELMKLRGDAHEGKRVAIDCTHWNTGAEIWKPFQFLLNSLIEHNHKLSVY